MTGHPTPAASLGGKFRKKGLVFLGFFRYNSRTLRSSKRHWQPSRTLVRPHQGDRSRSTAPIAAPVTIARRIATRRARRGQLSVVPPVGLTQVSCGRASQAVPVAPGESQATPVVPVEFRASHSRAPFHTIADEVAGGNRF